MRALGAVLKAFAVVISLTGIVAAQDVMNWQPNLEAAQQLAARTNRLVMVHCYTPSCQPCARLEKEVFSKQETARALDANYILVKLNCEESPGTAHMYGVTSVPTDLVLTPSGHLVTSIPSPPSAGQYIAELTQTATNYRNLARGNQPTMSANTNPSAPADMNAGRAAPASAVLPAAPGANNSTAANASPQSTQQPPQQERYAEYYKQQPPASGVNQGNAAMAPPVTTNPYLSTNAASTNPAATANAAASNVAAPPANAPNYAPGSIGATYPSSNTAQINAQPNYQQPPAYQPPPAYQQPAAQARSTAPNAQAAIAPPRSGVQLAPGAPALGMDGYCPVALAERNQWIFGDKNWGVVHRGRTYLFAGAEEQKKFWSNPDHYSPVLSGNDPVLALDNQITVPGKREFGVFYNNRVYLFADESSLQRFEQNTNRYTAEALQAMR